MLEGNATLNVRDIEGMTELHRAVTGWSIPEPSDNRSLNLDDDWWRNPTSRKYKLCEGDEFSFDEFDRYDDKGNEILQHSESTFYRKFVFFPNQNLTSADRYSFHLWAWVIIMIEPEIF